MNLPNEQEIQSFLDGFKPAAQEAASILGVAVSELWEVGLRKQLADGILCSIAACFALVFVALSIYGINAGVTYEKEHEYDPGGDMIFTISGVALVISTLVFVGSIIGAVHHLVVPEFTLIQEILEMMK